MLDGVKTLLVRIGGDIAGAHTSFNQFNQSLDRVGFSAVKVGAALTGATLAMGKLAERGTDVLNVAAAFTSRVGDQETALHNLRSATRGMVSDYDLMVGFNRAATLGAATTKEEYSELARTAISLGKALGQDAASALESLSLGIGRQSKLILDNLGLIVSVSEANEKYARTLNKTAGELSDAEKREAFRTAAMESARAKVTELGQSVQSAGDDWARFTAEVKNAKDELAMLVAESGFVQSVFSEWGAIFRELRGHDVSAEAVIGSLANLPDDMELLQHRATALREEFFRLNLAVGEVAPYARGSRAWKNSLEELKDTAAALSYLEGRIQSLKAAQAGAAASGPAAPSFAPPGLAFTWENARMLVDAIEKTEEELGKARFDLSLSKTADEADNLSVSIQELEGRLLSLKRLAGSWGGLGYVQSFLLPRPGGDPMARMPGSMPGLGASPVSARSSVSADGAADELNLLERAARDLKIGFTDTTETFLDFSKIGSDLASWGISSALGFIAGNLFGGKSERELAVERALEANRAALDRNTSTLQNQFAGSTSGNVISGVRNALASFLAPGSRYNQQILKDQLIQVGLTMEDLKDVAASLNLEWVHSIEFYKQLYSILQEISSEDLVGTLAGQLSMLGKEWDLLDITDPQEKMGSIMEKLSEWLSEGLFSQLEGIDWTDPNGFLEELLGSIWAGTFDLSQLEGIGLEEFISILLQLESFGDEVGNATEELASLTTALRNAPSGFKIALARFNATVADPRVIRTDPPGGGGIGPGGITITTLNINGANKDGKQLWAEIEKEMYRASARAGASTLQLSI